LTGAMDPDRQGVMASMVVRAMVAGTFVNLMNACIAGNHFF